MAEGTPAARWRSQVYDGVEDAADKARAARMMSLSSTTLYKNVKFWDVNGPEYSFSSGEEGLLGYMVAKRYLDDRRNLKGTRLKLLCRLGCLPVMQRVGRESTPRWPERARTCLMCAGGHVEDVWHFVMDCPAYTKYRDRMLSYVGRVMGGWGAGGVGVSDVGVFRLLLGARIGDPQMEDRVHIAFK